MKKQSLADIVEAQIRQLKVSPEVESTGIVMSSGDGVASIFGLSKARYTELLDISTKSAGIIQAIALNLEEDNIGAVVLGDSRALSAGDEVKLSGKILSVPVGEELLGRVVNPLGVAKDARPNPKTKQSSPAEKIAPGVISRQSVNTPLQTGIKAIDAMIPIGRGQRELIIGDRQVGKTAIAIDTIINQAKLNKKLPKGTKPVFCIYVAIGQKEGKVAKIVDRLTKEGAMEYTTVVATSASDSAPLQYLAPFAGCAMGEYFRDKGQDALIVYDDLSKHAVAYRQMSLLLRRPAGREAYPGDVFYLHSRLLERSAYLSKKDGGGSLTALPIIETQAGDVSAYIPTNVISITDGQIYLETDLFNQGVRPALNVGLSVSRVGGAAQIKAMKQVAGKLRLELAQFRELQAFAQFSTDLDPKTRMQIERGERITEVLKQPQYEPMPVEEQVCLIFAVSGGFFDSVELGKINDFQNKLLHFLRTEHADLLSLIRVSGEISEKTQKALEKALDKIKPKPAKTQDGEEEKSVRDKRKEGLIGEDQKEAKTKQNSTDKAKQISGEEAEVNSKKSANISRGISNKKE